MDIKLVVIPRELHDRLLAKCDGSDYECLINGFVVHDGTGREVIEIPCDRAGADLIMNLAGRECPESLPAIRLANLPTRHRPVDPDLEWLGARDERLVRKKAS